MPCAAARPRRCLQLSLAALPTQPRLSAGAATPTTRRQIPSCRRPVLWSLSALLTSQDAARLGFCQAEGCGWFFVDESPNHARTWCSSEVCGNRERARRAYAKRIRQLPSTAFRSYGIHGFRLWVARMYPSRVAARRVQPYRMVFGPGGL